MVDTKNNNRILFILFVGVLMGALDISIVGPAMPSIRESIKTDSQSLSKIFSIYVLFNLIGISLMAKLSDIFGRRKIYVLAISIFALGSLVVALSKDMTVLLIGRGIQGFGSSGIFPVASAVIGDIFPPEKRGRTLGLIGAVFGIAFIIGPIIAGTLLLYFTWNILFIINLPIILGLIWLSLKYLPNVPVGKKGGFDWKGILLLAVFLVSFLLGIDKIHFAHFYSSFISWSVFPLFIIAIIAFILFLVVENTAKTPVVKTQVFYSTQIRVAGILALGTGIFQSSFVFIPEYAVNLFKVSSSTASFMLIPVVTAIAISSPISGRLIDKIGSKFVIIPGLVFTGTGLFLLSFAHNSLFVFHTAGVFIGMGLAILLGSSLRYIMLNEVSPIDRAATQGIITIFISIGQITGSEFIGALVDLNQTRTSGLQKAFFYMAIISILFIITSLLLKTRKEEIETISLNQATI
jgi:MFS family permease